MASVTITRGSTLPDSSAKADFHNLVDLATGTVTNIVNADIDSAAAIADTKLATISTAGKVSGAALTLLPNVPSGAGVLPTANWLSGLTGVISFLIDGGGTTITTGVKGDIYIPFACTLTGWTLLGDTTGSIVVDVWKDTYANFPPTDADAMPGSGKEPTISSSTKGQDLTITDWTTDDVSAGDTIRFNVDSCTSITRATLALHYTRV